MKLHRKVQDSGLMQMHSSLAMFLYMVMKAAHKPVRIGTVDLERGQLVSGRHQLANDLGLTDRKTRTCIDHLLKLEFVSSKSTNKFTVYTIVNYEKYQDDNSQPSSKASSKRPANVQQTSTIQEAKKQISKEEINTSIVYSKSFLAFWELYPKKKSKAKASQSFRKLKQAEYAEIRSGLLMAKGSEDWVKENGKYIPNPAKWLDDRGWEDEYTSSTIRKAWE